MYFTPLNQLFAFLGSAAWIGWMILSFGSVKGKGRTKLTWKKFWIGSWADWAKVFLFGQIVTFLQENIVNMYVSYKENIGRVDGEDLHYIWNFYIDNEELIAWCVGIFGAYIFGRFYKVGHKKLSQ